MLKELAALIHDLLATNQSFHALQLPDGTYRKRAGKVTQNLLEKILNNNSSIAIYQKNTDNSINWICFDFDILKANLANEKKALAKKELERVVSQFSQSLKILNIPHLLEFSGNRGFHIWITFKESISYRSGYEIQQTLIDATELDINQELIALDLFPNTAMPTDGVGLGVKAPLSKHTKSQQYSFLLSSSEEISSISGITSLNTQVISKNIEILKRHKSTSKSELETILDTIFNITHDERLSSTRIKSIKIEKNGFTLDQLLSHWQAYPPLRALSLKINKSGNLSHEERKLLVGLFNNIQAKNISDAGQQILHKIFEKTENYNKEITNQSIKKLSSFNFPSQEQIEKITKEKFQKTFSTQELIEICIPKLLEYEDATFEISNADIEITKSAELKYLFLNDEAYSKTVINELSSDDNDKLLNQAKNLIKNSQKAGFYRHFRNETNKIRTLITLKAPERIATSCIIKQLIYFLDIEPSDNSHGYRANRGFGGGYIFQPWLFLWIKFVSNISTAIEDTDYQDYYIVKTDIKNFYDKIPHDNLKRMLLGGSGLHIGEKLSGLEEKAKQQYNLYIDFLFEITEKTTKSKIGMPQGPAYARYLAELYLYDIDAQFDNKIQQEEIQLYQRYVDDIFFIAPTEEKAKEIFNHLRSELDLLGLKINNEKTIITKISNFSEDFNSYRSQSKYAVDKVSSDYSGSTDTQKNLAINEFMNLVQSDSCNDDLAFIFSHLAGVPQLDSWKKAKVEPTVKAKIGRGSLYKHLFNFILDSPENWVEFEKIDHFDELQSEVLTACMISALETSKSSVEGLKSLTKKLEKKLTASELTNENLTYISLVFGVTIQLNTIHPTTIINTIKSLPNIEKLYTDTYIIEKLNTSLNDIKPLPEFIEAIYPICASENTERTDLNNLAITFYAKLSADLANGKLSTKVIPEINSSSIASKFYYLLCLFSISDKNTSSDLLIDAWKYCAYIFNTCDTEISYRSSDWFKKISFIEYSEEKALLLISSIVDGNIFRGMNDKKKVFEKFHNLLLIYITFQNNKIRSNEINDALNMIKEKATFYQWLIENEQTLLFPTTNRSWFDKNIIENSSIILKKGNSLLFRKPTTSFHSSSNPENHHNGYSEVIVEHSPTRLNTLADTLLGQSAVEKIKKLIEIMNIFESSGTYPNIFCSERMLIDNSLMPFSNELTNSKAIIYEDKNGNTETLINNQKNFIKAYFQFSSERSNSLQSIKEKYLENLDDDFDIVSFIKNLYSQLEDINEENEDFYFDTACAAALYLSLPDIDITRKIDKFINHYHKFNQNYEDRHIYAIDQDTNPNDEAPTELLDTVINSLKLIPTKIISTLSLYIYRDIEAYKDRLNNLIETNSPATAELDINKFRRVYPRVLPLSESLNIDGKDYQFKNIKLLNLTTNETHSFEVRHSIAISSSEHVYFFETSQVSYIAAINSSISKIYYSIEKRAANRTTSGIPIKSYPATFFDEESIISLNNFDTAVDVIQQHRDMLKQEAQQVLVKWLGSIPKKFRQMLTTLISAHVVMRKEDISDFTEKVDMLIHNKEYNPFLIKRIGDFNGTHRILFQHQNIGRSIDSLSPLNIQHGAETATIITDNIITGSQIISSIKYYLTGNGKRPNANFFEIHNQEQKELKEKLLGLKSIYICTVLYTENALTDISNELKTLLDPSISIKIICGRNIGDDAIFGTTQKIGEQEKNTIRSVLRDQEFMQELIDHLYYPQNMKSSLSYSDNEINKLNLVARYKSLPKKCFPFLHSGLINDPLCHPLARVPELNELH